MNSKIKKILNKKNKSKIVCLTAYSKNIAKILDKHCDIILVETNGKCFIRSKNTHKISLQNIIDHSLSVKKG